MDEQTYALVYGRLQGPAVGAKGQGLGITTDLMNICFVHIPRNYDTRVLSLSSPPQMYR